MKAINPDTLEYVSRPLSITIWTKIFGSWQPIKDNRYNVHLVYKPPNDEEPVREIIIAIPYMEALEFFHIANQTT